jgi:hypothetical protein
LFNASLDAAVMRRTLFAVELLERSSICLVTDTRRLPGRVIFF